MVGGMQILCQVWSESGIALIMNTDRHAHSLLTEVVDGFPVVLMDCKPFTVTRADVNVDRAEIVILLMTWKGSATSLL